MSCWRPSSGPLSPRRRQRALGRSSAVLLLERRERLTRSDHQTHRRYTFAVPLGCAEVSIRVRYAPKLLSAAESKALLEASVRSQRRELQSRLGETLASRWAADFDAAELIVPNLLTISIDDALGAYR